MDVGSVRHAAGPRRVPDLMSANFPTLVIRPRHPERMGHHDPLGVLDTTEHLEGTGPNREIADA